jgi:hypothetical protein
VLQSYALLPAGSFTRQEPPLFDNSDLNPLPYLWFAKMSSLARMRVVAFHVVSYPLKGGQAYFIKRNVICGPDACHR